MRTFDRAGTIYRTEDFRYRMTIQQVTETRGADGSVIETWGTYKHIWAHYDSFEGNETIVGPELTATANRKVICREVEGVTPKMRVLYGDRVFEIVSVVQFRQGDMRLTRLVCWETE